MIPVMAACQENKEETEEKFAPNQFGIGLGHLHIPTGLENGEKKWIGVPFWSFDYSRWFNRKWAIGLHNDIVFEEFEVEKDQVTIERKHPITSVVVGMYKPGKHFAYV